MFKLAISVFPQQCPMEMICAKFDVDLEVCFPGVTGRHGGGVYACFGVWFFFKDKQPIKRYLVPLFNVKYRIYSNIVLFQVQYDSLPLFYTLKPDNTHCPLYSTSSKYTILTHCKQTRNVFIHNQTREGPHTLYTSNAVIDKRYKRHKQQTKQDKNSVYKKKINIGKCFYSQTKEATTHIIHHNANVQLYQVGVCFVTVYCFYCSIV